MVRAIKTNFELRYRMATLQRLVRTSNTDV